MPRRRSASSLQSLCLKKVAMSMQHIWDKGKTDHEIQPCHVRCPEGPFRELAGFLVHDLLQLMGESQYLNWAVLPLLLVPQLKELNLSICPELVNKDIARIIMVRCKILSSLDLQECKQIPAETLADLVKGLPGLTKLDLSDTQCDTQVLDAVGSCCRRLRDLDISCCHRLSPASLLHLAYDPTVGSFRCLTLQRLVISEQNPIPSSLEQFWSLAVAFILLALPSLKVLLTDFDYVAEAVCLIHHQQFDSTRIAPGFPSLEEVAHCRVPTYMNEISRLTLPLKKILLKNETFLPVVRAVCPKLTNVTVWIRSSPGQTFFKWRYLTHLAIICGGSRDLRELLPVATSLGAQLESLSFSGFSFEDKLSFHTLLSHCLNLKKLSASLLPPLKGTCVREPGLQALSWDFHITPLKFSHLCDFFLLPSNLDDRLPSEHAAALRASLVSLLKHSPCLQSLELICLPFSLDEVFEEVLEAPGTALVHLCKLFLLQDEVSIRAIQLLLSSKNQLCFLRLDTCRHISVLDYNELLAIVHREGFELHIVWR